MSILSAHPVPQSLFLRTLTRGLKVQAFPAKEQALKITQLSGTVWQSERYDRINRNDQEFRAIWEYIRQNPVKAGLSATPEEYPFFWQESETNQFL